MLPALSLLQRLRDLGDGHRLAQGELTGLNTGVQVVVLRVTAEQLDVRDQPHSLQPGGDLCRRLSRFDDKGDRGIIVPGRLLQCSRIRLEVGANEKFVRR